jgi:hypothetical protein
MKKLTFIIIFLNTLYGVDSETLSLSYYENHRYIGYDDLADGDS